MWLFTRFGFFSIVRKPGDADDTLTLRSRTRGDLLRLKRHHLPVLQDPVAQPGSPYPWRAGCPAEALAWAMPGLVRDIDYPHFRDEVALGLGADRAARHTRVWHALFGLPDDLPEPLLDGPPATGSACGGVVMDRDGRVLLRCIGDDPADDLAFAAAAPQPGESPRAAALRAVHQATGARVDLLLPLPGATAARGFLMVADAEDTDLGPRPGAPAGLRWAHGATLPTAAAGDDAVGWPAALRLLPPTAPGLPRLTRPGDRPTRPMPAQREALPFERRLTEAQVARLLRGHAGDGTDARWFVVVHEGVLHAHRGDTGVEVYRVSLSPSADGSWRAGDALANRHPAEHAGTTASADAARLQALFDTLLADPSADGPRGGAAVTA